MKNIKRYILIIGIIIFFISIKSISAIIYSSISGQIYDQKTKQPIENVDVLISSKKKGIKTDKDGQFTFNMLPFGKYEIICQKEEYFEKKEEVIVIEGQNITDYNFYLTLGGSISGKIFSPGDTTLLSNANIVLNNGKSAFSDGMGNYKIAGLENAEYWMIISYPAYSTIKGNFAINNLENKIMNFSFTNLSNSISGKVYDTVNSNAIINAKVSCVDIGLVFNTTTIQDGSYELKGLDTGYIYCMVSADGYASKEVGLQFDSFSMNINYDFYLSKENIVKGKVIDSINLTPIDNAAIFILKQTTGEIPEEMLSEKAQKRRTMNTINQLNNPVITDHNGYFIIHNLDLGRYAISAAKEGYIANYKLVEINGGQDIGNVVIELTTE